MKFAISLFFYIVFQGFSANAQISFNLVSIEKERVLNDALHYKNEKPITITRFLCERSAGTAHDFYSEGDYWWPDPENPSGPYLRKDGLTNPENFTKHRELMVRFSQISGAMASAYVITKNERYVKQLMPHLKAWFVNPKTRMNQNLLYAQAIKGVATGRGIGIIDTIHLMEVALAVKTIETSKSVSQTDIAAIKSWFSSYLEWLTTHPFGIAERDNGNNHSVCWAMQVAVFAKLVNNQELLAYCSTFYKNTLLPNQMAANGSFPLELARTKPYGYSIFNLDAMATLCQILSSKEENMFAFQTSDGRSLALGLAFLFPYLKNKNEWPYQKDVMYWEDWPVRQPSLLFGGLALDNKAYLETWKSLNPQLTKQEIIRNMPVRYPLLWME
ncbi:alginate lyase family protein [Mariniflexile maritimum]|uniref:alginate lyase family protein n=1 Tax=Mariniflexile maritimum TaxID=2682493 RepID=UPI0012F6699A|nr:alginate lyase family protein [Mariniflexile maritimum]